MNPPTGRRKKEPHVGIFWLAGGKLLIDITPLSKAEPYGDHLIHPRSHLEAWALFQQNGIAPEDVEYEEPPRGRVIYNTKTLRFTPFADMCVHRDPNVVRKIMAAMNLPAETATDEDSHYRCAACLKNRID